MNIHIKKILIQVMIVILCMAAIFIIDIFLFQKKK